MNLYILLFSIMGTNLFFLISAIIGYEYAGINESNIYLLYCIVVAGLSLLISFKFFLIDKRRFSRNELIIFLLPILITSSFLVTYLINGSNQNSFYYFGSFLLFSVPAIFIGVYYNNVFTINDIAKWFEIIMLIISISIVKSVLTPFLGGFRFTNIGGASHQIAAYTTAFAYGLNLYFIFFGRYYERFKFMRKRIYQYLSIVLLPVQMVAVFLTGGRGGLVLVFVYSTYILFVVFKSKKISNIRRLTFLILIAIVLSAMIFPRLTENEIFQKGFNRTIQFLSLESGINWSGSSSRDTVYLQAIEYIKKKPIIGYGVFGFYYFTHYPHNFFLEVLLGGGIIYFAIIIPFIIWIYLRLKNMIKFNHLNRLILIILLFPLTKLMFSGTYLVSSELWFCVSAILTYKFRTDLKKS